MFTQYHDIVKPTYLTVINKLLISEETIPLPLNLISCFSQLGLVEWYINRKNVNPLIDLDIYHHYSHEDLNQWMNQLLSDISIYEFSPPMKLCKMLAVKDIMKLSFPVYVYSEEYNQGIEKDIKESLRDANPMYIHGPLDEVLKKMDMNYTYIFSNIELAREAAELLSGATSHILVSSEYRYNYNDWRKKDFKYDPESLMRKYPVCRVEGFRGIDRETISTPITNLRGANDDTIEKYFEILNE